MERAQTKPYFVLNEDIYFICVTYLFDFWLVFKFSFVIYIYIILKFCYLAVTSIQCDLQMRTIEAIKTKEQ